MLTMLTAACIIQINDGKRDCFINWLFGILFEPGKHIPSQAPRPMSLLTERRLDVWSETSGVEYREKVEKRIGKDSHK